jgi:hypothetical protein
VKNGVKNGTKNGTKDGAICGLHGRALIRRQPGEIALCESHTELCRLEFHASAGNS